MTTAPVHHRPVRTRPDPVHQRRTAPWWRAHRTTVLPTVTILCILAVWQVAGWAGAWDPLFFSDPAKIWQGFVQLAGDSLWSSFRVSGEEFVLGMGISILIGIPAGLVLGSVPSLYYAFDPIISALNATPIIVLMPLMIVWFGLETASKVAIVVCSATLPFVINTMEGVKATDVRLLRAARSFGCNGVHLYWTVYLPSIVPFLTSGLQTAIGRGLIGVVAGEFIVASAGVGFQIRQDAEVYNTARYLAGVMVVVVIAVLLMAGVRLVEKRALRWRRSHFAE